MPLSRTPLRSLKSNATLFVPGEKSGTAPAAPVAPCVAPGCTAREAATGPVRGVIESAFAGKLNRISMCDMPSHTEIEVVVHAGPSDMYKFAGQWMIDTAARVQAVFALLTMYQTLGPQIISAEPSADGTQLFIGYSGASPEQICAEFWEYGYCAMESFIITIVMQPWGSEASEMAPAALAAPTPEAHVSGSVSGSIGASLKCEVEKQSSLEGGSDDAETASTDAGSERCDSSSTPTPIKTSPLRTFRPRSGRACWADIEDEDD